MMTETEGVIYSWLKKCSYYKPMRISFVIETKDFIILLKTVSNIFPGQDRIDEILVVTGPDTLKSTSTNFNVKFKQYFSLVTQKAQNACGQDLLAF